MLREENNQQIIAKPSSGSGPAKTRWPPLDIDQFYRKKEEFQSQLDDNEEEEKQIKT